jgi:hypothetical protein
MVQVLRHIPVIVERVLVLFPNHTVYIQLWNKDVLQDIEVHVTRNGSLGEEQWAVNLCSANSTENTPIRRVWQMLENLIPILRSPDN